MKDLNLDPKSTLLAQGNLIVTMIVIAMTMLVIDNFYFAIDEI